MEFILITQLFHRGQQVVDDGSELRAVQALQHIEAITEETSASLKDPASES